MRGQWLWRDSEFSGDDHRSAGHLYSFDRLFVDKLAQEVRSDRLLEMLSGRSGVAARRSVLS
jgi:hypothetical protein